MTDQKSRGGKKAAGERQPRGKAYQGTTATRSKGRAPAAAIKVRGRRSQLQEETR